MREEGYLPLESSALRRDAAARASFAKGAVHAANALDGRFAVLLAGLGLLLLLGLPTLLVPLATDQAYFALGAQTLLDGDQLYRDFWDIKPPSIYLLYALSFGAFGEHTTSVRVLDLANTAVATTAVFLLTRRFFGDRAGLFAGGLYAFAYLGAAGFDGLGQTEGFMAAPVAFAIAAYRPRAGRGSGRAAFVAGLLLGVAVSLKFSALVFVLALPIAEFVLRDRREWGVRAALQRLGWAAAGLLLVQAAWIGYLASAGSLEAFVDIQRRYTVSYHALRWAPDSLSYPRFLALATSEWLRNTLYLTLPAGIALFIALRRGPRPAVILLASLAVLGVASVWWQGKLLRYHWLIMLPLLAPLAGYALDEATEWCRTLPRPHALAAFALIAGGLVLVATTPLLDTYDRYRLLVERASGTMTAREVESAYLDQLDLNRQLADYVQANSAPDETVYVWGFWPVSYLWSERDSPTPFVTNAGLRATWAPDAWRAELIGDLRADPPRFIAVASGDSQPWLVGTEQTSREHFCGDFPELRRFVENAYRPVLDNGLFILYERDAPAARAASACCEKAEAQSEACAARASR